MLYRLIKPCSTGEEPEEVMMGEVQRLNLGIAKANGM